MPTRAANGAWAITFVLAALGLCFPLASVSAQEAETASTDQADNVQEAQRHFKRGVALTKRSRWRDALAQFESAWQLAQRPSIAFNLASARYRLGLYLEAEQALSDYDRLASKDDPKREEARHLVEELSRSIVRLHFEVEPAHAQLTVDGDRWPEPGPVVEIRLNPGSHDVVLSLPGRRAKSETITLEPGSRVARHWTLTEREVLSDDQKPHTVTGSTGDRQSSWSGVRWAGLGVGTAGAAGLILGGVFSLLAADRDAASNRDCDGNLCGSQGTSDREAAQRWASAATVAVITGGVLVGAGAVLFVVGGESEDTPTAQLVPELAPQYAGLRLSGAL